MKPVDYFSSLTEAQKKDFAERVGSSLAYLRLHVFRQKGGFRKRPGDDLIVRIVSASEKNITLDEAIDYFLVQPVLKVAAELDSSQCQAMPENGRVEVNCLDAQDKPRELRRLGVVGGGDISVLMGFLFLESALKVSGEGVHQSTVARQGLVGSGKRMDKKIAANVLQIHAAKIN